MRLPKMKLLLQSKTYKAQHIDAILVGEHHAVPQFPNP